MQRTKKKNAHKVHNTGKIIKLPVTVSVSLQPPLSMCTNCDRPLRPGDRFCPGCGQKNQDLTIPFRRLVSEMLEGFLHLDGKSFQTIKALVLKPGFLTSEYIGGRRVRFVTPVRLYVFVSFVFFFCLLYPPESVPYIKLRKRNRQVFSSHFWAPPLARSGG
jgi:hypothetical protein